MEIYRVGCKGKKFRILIKKEISYSIYKFSTYVYCLKRSIVLMKNQLMGSSKEFEKKYTITKKNIEPAIP